MPGHARSLFCSPHMLCPDLLHGPIVRGNMRYAVLLLQWEPASSFNQCTQLLAHYQKRHSLHEPNTSSKETENNDAAGIVPTSKDQTFISAASTETPSARTVCCAELEAHSPVQVPRNTPSLPPQVQATTRAHSAARVLTTQAQLLSALFGNNKAKKRCPNRRFPFKQAGTSSVMGAQHHQHPHPHPHPHPQTLDPAPVRSSSPSTSGAPVNAATTANSGAVPLPATPRIALVSTTTIPAAVKTFPSMKEACAFLDVNTGAFWRWRHEIEAAKGWKLLNINVLPTDDAVPRELTPHAHSKSALSHSNQTPQQRQQHRHQGQSRGKGRSRGSSADKSSRVGGRGRSRGSRVGGRGGIMYQLVNTRNTAEPGMFTKPDMALQRIAQLCGRSVSRNNFFAAIRTGNELHGMRVRKVRCCTDGSLKDVPLRSATTAGTSSRASPYLSQSGVDSDCSGGGTDDDATKATREPTTVTTDMAKTTARLLSHIVDSTQINWATAAYTTVTMTTAALLPPEPRPSHRQLQGTLFLPFGQAVEYMHDQKLQSVAAWKVWKETSRRPTNIPSNPHTIYAFNGWQGYSDWLGYSRCSATLAQSPGGNSKSPTVKSPDSKPKRRRVSRPGTCLLGSKLSAARGSPATQDVRQGLRDVTNQHTLAPHPQQRQWKQLPFAGEQRNTAVPFVHGVWRETGTLQQATAALAAQIDQAFEAAMATGNFDDVQPSSMLATNPALAPTQPALLTPAPARVISGASGIKTACKNCKRVRTKKSRSSCEGCRERQGRDLLLVPRPLTEVLHAAGGGVEPVEPDTEDDKDTTAAAAMDCLSVHEADATALPSFLPLLRPLKRCLEVDISLALAAQRSTCPTHAAAVDNTLNLGTIAVHSVAPTSTRSHHHQDQDHHHVAVQPLLARPSTPHTTKIAEPVSCLLVVSPVKPGAPSGRRLGFKPMARPSPSPSGSGALLRRLDSIGSLFPGTPQTPATTDRMACIPKASIMTPDQYLSVVH